MAHEEKEMVIYVSDNDITERETFCRAGYLIWFSEVRLALLLIEQTKGGPLTSALLANKPGRNGEFFACPLSPWSPVPQDNDPQNPP